MKTREEAVAFHLDADGVILNRDLVREAEKFSGTQQEKQAYILEKQLAIQCNSKIMQWMEKKIQETNAVTIFLMSFSNRQCIRDDFHNRNQKRSSLFIPVLENLAQAMQKKFPERNVVLVRHWLADLYDDFPFELNQEEESELQALKIKEWNLKNQNAYFDWGKLNIFLHNLNLIQKITKTKFSDKEIQLQHYFLEDIFDILYPLYRFVNHYPKLIPSELDQVFFYRLKWTKHHHSKIYFLGEVKGEGLYYPDFSEKIRGLSYIILQSKESPANLIELLRDDKASAHYSSKLIERYLNKVGSLNICQSFDMGFGEFELVLARLLEDLNKPAVISSLKKELKNGKRRNSYLSNAYTNLTNIDESCEKNTDEQRGDISQVAVNCEGEKNQKAGTFSPLFFDTLIQIEVDEEKLKSTNKVSL